MKRRIANKLIALAYRIDPSMAVELNDYVQSYALSIGEQCYARGRKHGEAVLLEHQQMAARIASRQ